MCIVCDSVTGISFRTTDWDEKTILGYRFDTVTLWEGTIIHLISLNEILQLTFIS